MSGFPNTTPASQIAASALLSNAAATAGLTNTVPLDRLGNLEQVVANLLTDLPVMRLDRVNAITAFATGGQASATALTANINRITTCATAGDSVKLPTAAPGLSVVVINDGAAACDIFPVTGDQIDTLAANTAIRVAAGSRAVFYCTVALIWVSMPTPLPYAKYTLNATAGATTAAAGDLTGAAVVSAAYSGVSGAALTTRTATQMFADTPNARVGDRYLLILTNTSAGTTTLTAGTGVTLTGTMTLATNTVRQFIVTFTSATAITIQSIAVGTIS